jgi:hypothetical protein
VSFYLNLSISNTYLRNIELEMENTINTTYHNNIMLVNNIIHTMTYQLTQIPSSIKSIKHSFFFIHIHKGKSKDIYCNNENSN